MPVNGYLNNYWPGLSWPGLYWPEYGTILVVYTENMYYKTDLVKTKSYDTELVKTKTLKTDMTKSISFDTPL